MKKERDAALEDDEINPVLLRHLAEEQQPGAFPSNARPPNLAMSAPPSLSGTSTAMTHHFSFSLLDSPAREHSHALLICLFWFQLLPPFISSFQVLRMFLSGPKICHALFIPSFQKAIAAIQTQPQPQEAHHILHTIARNNCTQALSAIYQLDLANEGLEDLRGLVLLLEAHVEEETTRSSLLMTNCNVLDELFLNLTLAENVNPVGAAAA